jgi:hypothetical protein
MNYASQEGIYVFAPIEDYGTERVEMSSVR